MVPLQQSRQAFKKHGIRKCSNVRLLNFKGKEETFSGAAFLRPLCFFFDWIDNKPKLIFHEEGEEMGSPQIRKSHCRIHNQNHSRNQCPTVDTIENIKFLYWFVSNLLLFWL